MPLLSIILIVAAAEPVERSHTYLNGVARHDACTPRDSKDVVVCGRKDEQEQYRLHPLVGSERYEPRHVRAELGLGGGTTLGVAAQNKDLTPGQRSQRVMLTLGIPF